MSDSAATGSRDPDPDHFEGNIGANIAGGRYPDGATGTGDWRHMCIELIRDAAPNWNSVTPKGERCEWCSRTENEVRDAAK